MGLGYQGEVKECVSLLQQGWKDSLILLGPSLTCAPRDMEVSQSSLPTGRVLAPEGRGGTEKRPGGGGGAVMGSLLTSSEETEQH